MRLQATSILITLLIIIAFPGTGFCNDPAQDTPWPIGSNTGEMNISRTLMNSYGDLNGSWLYSVFHAGIDIDGTTGYPNCNEVRCVDGGYATIVKEKDIPGTDGETEWIVIICDEPGGTIQNGWSYGHLAEPSFSGLINPYLESGQLVGQMTDVIDTPHLHFMWTDWNENRWSYCNPLKYLSPSPTFEDNYNWTFNPDNNDPSFDHFFLEDMNFSAWENLTVTETQNLMLDPASLSGNVDFFFGVSLRGDGMPFGGGVGRNDLTSQKIKYDVVRELVTSDETLDTKHVFDFDCVLNTDTLNSDTRPQMLYFRHSMNALFGHDALTYCLSNCTSSEDWNGINTIDEKFWNTDCFEVDETNSTENPVLAKYPDGSYSLDVTCYSFDEDSTFPASIPCELHNFSPALRHVSINEFYGGCFYYATWEPNGLSAELDTYNVAASAGTLLDVQLVFTESMDTNSLSAVLGTQTVNNGVWSSSVVPNDTWTGEVTLPANRSGGGSYILSVSANDTDGLSLMNPQGAGTVPDSPTPDTHHSLSLDYGAGLDWTVPVHDQVLGSPKLTDIDLDGDLDVIIQSKDGWVDVLDDDGSSMSGWPVSGNWSSGNPDVWASPAIVNLTGNVSSAPEILAVHPNGCNGFLATGVAINPWHGLNATTARWNALSSPVTGNFNGTGNNEYVLGRQRAQGVINPTNLLAHSNNGDGFWVTAWGEDESVSSTPSLADVNNDGNLEVIAVSDYMSFNADNTYGTVYCLDAATKTEKWNKYVGGMIVFGAIVTGNLDSDSYLEIVVGATAGSNSIKVLDGDTGTIQYSKSVSGGVYAGASIADIDGDSDNDIVVSSQGGMLYCWDGATGDSLPGFPVNLGTWTDDGVSIGDIDGDDELELVIAGKDGKLYAINHDGSDMAGFPITVSNNALSGQPALGDIDDDGRLEIIFGEMNNSVIHCYEMGEYSAVFAHLPWPQFQRDARNTGCFTEPGAPSNLSETHTLTFDPDLMTVDLSWNQSPDDPGEVTCYRIYRTVTFGLGAKDIQMVGTVDAGVTTFNDELSLIDYNYCDIEYYVTAWDGENESPASNTVSFEIYYWDWGPWELIEFTLREIMQSTDAVNLSSCAAIGVETAPIDVVSGNCQVLADGKYDTAYIPSSAAECVEIDLGDVFMVNEVAVIRAEQLINDSPLSEIAGSTHEMRCDAGAVFQLSTDGKNFSISTTGHARYIRVYDAAGATEIKVHGSLLEENSSAIKIQSNSSDGYRIVAAETESPLSVTVFDLSGRSVWNGSSSTGEILWNRCGSSGNAVPAGVYLIMVESDDMETFTSKVVVR